MDELGDDRGHEDYGRVLVSEFLAHAAVRVPVRDWGLDAEGISAIRSILASFSKHDQVALLKAAVEELPAPRRSTEPSARRHGVLLSGAVSALYAARLPLTEDDLATWNSRPGDDKTGAVRLIELDESLVADLFAS